MHTKRWTGLLFSLPLALGLVGLPAAASAAPASTQAEGTYSTTRDAERLDRAPVAVTTEDGVFLSWRLLGNESMDSAFHVFRDGQEITTSAITDSTDYQDADGTADSTYRIALETEKGLVWASDEFTPWADQSLDVPLAKPADGTEPDGTTYSYRANDVMTSDLDGDGQLELVLKWDPTDSQDNSKAGYTGNVFLDAYELDGTQLWRVDLGHNIRAGAHYSQPQVYDFDSDGRAEVMVKTADGTVDGAGTVIGDADADYRSDNGYVLDGPEYLTVFEGTSGKAVDTIDYNPPRGDVAAWGDDYGNRVDRFLSATAYLDGEHPSAVFARGYYTRATLWAVDFDGEKLSERWFFDSDAEGNGGYAGQGNHNLTAADVDADGRDEIVYGSATIDDDGTGLYSTGLGHGDALHVGDFDPSRSGLEVFAVHEDVKNNGGIGSTFRDAATGEVLWSVPAVKDTGRGTMADIDPRYAGAEGWNVGQEAEWDSPRGSLRNVDGTLITETIPAANFVALWDGDLLSEIVDHTFDDTTRTGTPVVSDWDYENDVAVPVFEPEGVLTNNDTKGNPGLQADLLGDWREELVYRTEDSSALRIFTTTDPTEHRLRTLMSDPLYRMSVNTESVAYNQPPHTSYFLGEGMETPAAPNLSYTTPAKKSEPVTGVATDAPGKATLTSDNGWDTGLQDGDYTVTGNLWHGQNARSYVLYENGEKIAEGTLDDHTPEAQSFSVDVSGKGNGTYTYTADLTNSFGTTSTDPLTVRVTQAAPGKAVLSSDNWDGNGEYTVTADLWWGTNATSYTLYENGEVIDQQDLTADTPNAQKASTAVTGRESGTYTYTAELTNSAGTTTTDPITVKVK